MIYVLKFPLWKDLSLLIETLLRQGIRHEVVEESDHQALLVASEWDRLELQILSLGMTPPAPEADAPAGNRDWEQLRGYARRCPVTLGILALALLCFPLTWSTPDFLSRFLSYFLITPYLGGLSLTDLLSQGQIWRLFTPALLHFGFIHLLFNALWVWEFGRRLELGGGSFLLAWLTLLLAAVGNISQYLVSSTTPFGGLSGVVCGYLGFLIFASWLTGKPVFQLPRSMVLMLLGMLVLFSTNITSLFGLHIANAAHWGGFLSGIIAALAVYSPFVAGKLRSSAGG